MGIKGLGYGALWIRLYMAAGERWLLIQRVCKSVMDANVHLVREDSLGLSQVEGG